MISDRFSSVTRLSSVEMESLSAAVQYRDEITPIIYVEMPASKVVLFQAFFELYEGLGLVRTLDLKKSLLCILTTSSQLDSCLQALLEIQPMVEWKAARIPGPEEQEKYLGFFKNASRPDL